MVAAMFVYSFWKRNVPLVCGLEKPLARKVLQDAAVMFSCGPTRQVSCDSVSSFVNWQLWPYILQSEKHIPWKSTVSMRDINRLVRCVLPVCGSLVLLHAMICIFIFWRNHWPSNFFYVWYIKKCISITEILLLFITLSGHHHPVAQTLKSV